ncbi:hypothetical protein JTE90_010607 [Oedothorax gibbosus]|uniref:Uncharacterized protein n=1 Tax=Oedothorax gibbosus TaxID=931172 RepID=A0AAV6TSG3_9ARAC|nr:hypothetical protein JTE90_010607 [Oedothorax gibbosus]
MSSRSDCIFPRPVDIVAALDSSKDYWIAHLLQVMAYVSHITGDGDRIYHKPLDQNTFIKGKGLEHLKFCLHEVLGQVPFDSRQLDRTWDSIGRRLRRDPSRSLSNSNVCLLFKLHNMFLVKKGFTFGNWLVAEDEQHVIQTSNAAMLCFVLPKNSTIPVQERMRRHLPENYQVFYDRYVLPPHGTYLVPQNTRYVLVAVQKTIFALDVISLDYLFQGATPFDACKRYCTQQAEYNVPPPTPCRSPEPPPELMPPPPPKKRKSTWGSFKIPKKNCQPTPEPTLPIPVVPEPTLPTTMQPEIVPLPEKASHQFVPEMDFNSLEMVEEASEKSVADYVNNFFSNISFGDDPFQTSSFPDLDLSFLEQPNNNLILNPAQSKTIFGNPKDFSPVQIFYEEPEQEAPVNYSLK